MHFRKSAADEQTIDQRQSLIVHCVEGDQLGPGLAQGLQVSRVVKPECRVTRHTDPDDAGTRFDSRIPGGHGNRWKLPCTARHCQQSI